MKSQEKKIVLKQKRRDRIRKKVNGTVDRPRLVVSFSNKHIYAQCINDDSAVTLCALSSVTKSVKEQNIKPNVDGSTKFGRLFAEYASGKGINEVVFDRAGRRFHGCVKAFAEAVREKLVF